MADIIDQIKVKNSQGTDVNYDIDLPPDATPAITSLVASNFVAAPVIVKFGGKADEVILTNGSGLCTSDAYTLAGGRNCTVSSTGTISAVNTTF